MAHRTSATFLIISSPILTHGIKTKREIRSASRPAPMNTATRFSRLPVYKETIDNIINCSKENILNSNFDINPKRINNDNILMEEDIK